ncbi:penicillin-binding protein 1A [Nafulsella turpanensis]|uniref:penicillin-binding protein 1A n=1 Tax=Nafulsella turpanensis TaxID=1265690 RepID=UPI00034BAF8D|nr:transglycosylase domain-containing protein [Nafulsella turpanensis]
MAAETPKKKKKGTPSSKSKIYRSVVIGLWVLFIGGLLAFPLYVYTVSINFMGLYGGVPGFKLLENPENNLSSELYSADNVLLGKYFRENRVNATFDELSPNLVNSLVATEDVRFEEHAGIDEIGMMRVAVKSILLGQNAGGGSTLSQQLAKNLFNLRTDEDYEGKLNGINPALDLIISKTKEWILAVRLERAYTKKEILAMYLNTVDFGSNAFGIKVASQTFFNKTPNALDVHEAALLAGIVQAPSRLSPVYNPENALHRRNVVINQLEKYDFITTAQADSFQTLPLDLEYNVENHNQGPAPYFRSVIKDFLHSWSRENGYDLYEDGLKIYTTIDSRMQRYAEDAVNSHMAKLQKIFANEWKGQNPWLGEDNKELKGFIESEMKRTERYRSLVKRFGEGADSIDIILKTKTPMRVFSYKGEIDTLMSPMDSLRYYKRFLHTGFMAMDPYSGAVKAWVGGIDHKHFKFDHVKQGKRQPGSTFKPFVYATAIENGYSPCYTVFDVPQSYQTGGDPPTWSPDNSDGKFSGQPMNLREAMAKSINSVTANIMYKVGPENVVALAQRMGIKSHLEPVLALSLGISDVSVYEMVGAYSTFVNKGVYTEPYYVTRIEDKNGNVLYNPHPKTVEALNEETAYVMLHMLQGATQIEGGTAMGLSRELRHNIEIGGKTGTTQNGSDGWFMGVTPELVAGAWVGGDSRNIRFKSWYSGQGARTAMPIWQEFMLKVYNDPELSIDKTTFETPAKPVSVELNCTAYAEQGYGEGLEGEAADSVQIPERPAIDPNEIEF